MALTGVLLHTEKLHTNDGCSKTWTLKSEVCSWLTPACAPAWLDRGDQCVQARVPTPAKEAQAATAGSRPTSQEVASLIEGFHDDFNVSSPAAASPSGLSHSDISHSQHRHTTFGSEGKPYVVQL